MMTIAQQPLLHKFPFPTSGSGAAAAPGAQITLFLIPTSIS